MSAFPTDILIAKTGGREALDRTSHQAKVLLAKTVLKRIAERDPTALAPMQPDMRNTLEEALHLIELRCLDLAVAWRRDARSNEGIEFRDYCSLAFDIRRIVPLGETEDAVSKAPSASRRSRYWEIGAPTSGVILTRMPGRYPR